MKKNIATLFLAIALILMTVAIAETTLPWEAEEGLEWYGLDRTFEYIERFTGVSPELVVGRENGHTTIDIVVKDSLSETGEIILVTLEESLICWVNEGKDILLRQDVLTEAFLTWMNAIM